MTPELILVVCAANVCRSPLAELTLRQALEHVSGIEVASAGTSAREGRRICSAVGDFHDGESWSADARAHRTRIVSPVLVEQAALILVSSKDVRAEVVITSPEVRGRTYTLREAARLGEGFRPGSPSQGAGPVSAYAAHLDRARVVRGSAPSGHRPWLRPRRADGLDIIDGHGGSPRSHRAALEAVATAAADVASQLGGRST